VDVSSGVVFRTTRGEPFNARWAYNTTAPHAVTLTFHTPSGGQVEWVFARDLLTAALQTLTLVGEGDIRLLAAGSRLWVVLRPPGEVMRVSCPVAVASAFLGATMVVNPPCVNPACVDPTCVEHGRTRAALDEALTRILEETR